MDNLKPLIRNGHTRLKIHVPMKKLVVSSATVLSLLILAGCSRVESRDQDTDEINMVINTEIDGELNETRFVLSLTDATSGSSSYFFAFPTSQIELTRRDKIFVRFGDESYQVGRYSGGRFIATVPGIRTGEYRVDFERQNHIPAPDTVITINSHPTLLAPINGSTYTVGENIELVWETRNKNGPLTDRVRNTEWGIRDLLCIDETGSEVTEYDRDQTFIRNTRGTGIQFNGTQASQLINTTDLFEEFERSSQTEIPISMCELEINSRGSFWYDGFTPPIDEESSVQFIGDQNLANITSRGESISNSARITIFSNR